MTRIFLTLSTLSNLFLGVTLWLGFQIGDPSTAKEVGNVTVHIFSGLGALIFGIMVHSVVLTYFMGTGRWLEETCVAYRLGPAWYDKNKSLKWRLLPWLVLAILLLIVTGGFGGAADPGSTIRFQGWGGLTAAGVHQLVALTMLSANLLVNLGEYAALSENATLVNQVLAEVKRMRLERGLDV